MKKIIVFCLFTIVISLSCSQKKIDSIGDLRIGMTFDELVEVIDTSLLYVHPIRIFYEGSDFHFRDRTASLESHIVYENIVLKDISLDFFDNKLYQIVVRNYNPLLEEFFIEEYGEPETSAGRITYEGQDEEDIISDFTVFQYWRNTPRNVNCHSIITPGKKKYSFTLRDDKIYKKVRDERP